MSEIFQDQHPAILEKHHRQWVLGFAAIVLLATSLPYWVGFTLQGKDWYFTGFIFGVEDGNSYIAKMLSGSAGAWLFRTPYTAYPQSGVVMFLPYLLLGKLAQGQAIHEQLLALFHLFRLVAGFLEILAIDDFVHLFISDSRLRKLALVLATLGGGLGWLLIIVGHPGWLGSLSLDFYSPETFGFLGLYGIPHLALARALILWSLVIYLQGGRQVGLLAGTWSLAGLVQPLAAVVIGTVIGIHLLATAIWIRFRSRESEQWAGWRQSAYQVVLCGLLPGLFLLYNTVAVLRDPYLAIFARQNVIRSPHPAHYLLAYGLLLPFAWAGGRRLLKRDTRGALLLITWVIILPLLVYAPLDLQRRLADGVWVALIALAINGLVDLKSSGGMRLDQWAGAALIILLLPSTIMLWAGGVMSAARPALPSFRPAAEVDLFRDVQSLSSPGSIVLSSYETGNALPAWANVRVVIGQGPESANLASLKPQVAAFYYSMTDSERLAFLQQWDVDYVVYGPNEREAARLFASQSIAGESPGCNENTPLEPQQVNYLDLIAQHGEYQLYRVSK